MVSRGTCGPQRAEAVRQPLGQHRHSPLRVVDAGAAAVGLEVERVPFLDIVGDVGDVDAEAERPLAQALDRDRVVEVAGALAVDGDDDPVAQVVAARPSPLASGPPGRLRRAPAPPAETPRGCRSGAAPRRRRRPAGRTGPSTSTTRPRGRRPGPLRSSSTTTYSPASTSSPPTTCSSRSSLRSNGTSQRRPCSSASSVPDERVARRAEHLDDRGLCQAPVAARARAAAARQGLDEHAVAVERAFEVLAADKPAVPLPLSPGHHGTDDGVPLLHELDDADLADLPGHPRSRDPAPPQLDGEPFALEPRERPLDELGTGLVAQRAAELLDRGTFAAGLVEPREQALPQQVLGPRESN